MTSLASTAFDLRRIAAAAGGADFKALVCVFLYGGTDGTNTVVPRGPGYTSYAATRGALALPQASLLPIANSADGRQWGLHPSLPQVRSLRVRREPTPPRGWSRTRARVSDSSGTASGCGP